MALQPTALTLTPEWVDKRLSIVGGSPAVHEKVEITLTGGATALGAVPSNLVLRIHSPGSASWPTWHPLYTASGNAQPLEFARFPLTSTDAWAVSGDNLTCTIDLDTAALIAVFGNRSYDAIIDAVAVIESGAADNLYAVGRLRIRNWIINTGDPVLGSSVLKTRVDDLETALGAETAAREEADTAESQARAAADAALNSRVNNSALAGDLLQEIHDRTAADLYEAGVRAAADLALTDSIAGKAPMTAVTAETVARQQAVADEAQTREDADIALALAVAARATVAQFEAESAARGAAVEAEAQARTLADNALGDQITAKQTAPSNAALATLLNLDEIPAEFTETQTREVVNALLNAVKGLYA